MMKRTILITTLLLFLGGVAMAQQNFTLYQLRDVPQVMNHNPALTPENNFHIGIPLLSGIYGSISNSGFVYQDLIHKRKQDDSLTLDMTNMLTKLKTNNYLTMHAEAELLRGGLRFNNHYFSFSVTETVDGAITYPKDLFRLIWEGNGRSLLGETADLTGLGVDLTHYREYGIGYAGTFMDERLRIGVKAKYLYGMENIWTRNSAFALTTNETNYDLTLQGAMEVRTSGIDGLDNAEKYFFGANNHGLGMDIGGTYHIYQNLEVTASASDLGFITWKHDVHNYINKKNQFTFTGVDLNSIVNSTDPDVEAKADSVSQVLLDSVEQVVKFDSDSASYTQFLNPRFRVGGTYQLTQRQRVGALFYTRILKGTVRPGFSLSYAIEPVNWLTATGSYSVYNRGYTNLGLGFSINAGFFQFYLTSDNVLAIFAPHKFHNAHIMGGFNLTFGERKRNISAPRL